MHGRSLNLVKARARSEQLPWWKQVTHNIRTGLHLPDALYIEHGKHPGWRRIGKKKRWEDAGPALQVWLHSGRDPAAQRTEMNDFAYPLIIAHSEAERGPLIKMSWGTAGLLHLWQTPACLNNPGADPKASASKESGWSGRCHSVSTSAWCSAQSNSLNRRTQVEEGRGLGV